jgi:O-antigen ligase
MVRDNPVFGVGPDNFLYQYRAYMRPEAWAEPNISHPHNLVLDAWLSVGLFGLLALVATIALFWFDWARLVRRAAGRERFVAFGLAGAMAAALVHGLVDNGYFLVELAGSFWVLAAALYLMYWSEEPTAPAAEPAGPGPNLAPSEFEPSGPQPPPV